MAVDQDQYFANLPSEDLTPKLCARVEAYYNWLLTSGRLERWRVAYNTYYGNRGSHRSYSVTAAGEKGELSFLMSNEYRNLVQHILVMASQSKAALESVAENTDSASKAACYLADGIVEYYRRNGNVDQNIYNSTEIALIFDHGWVINEWDFLRGDDIRPDEQGQVLRAGDIYSRARTPLDVVIDYTRFDTDRDWIIVRDQVNKYDVVSQLSEADEQQKKSRDEILALKRESDNDQIFRFGEMDSWDNSDSPLIDRYTFYHRKTPSCPTGRMLQFYNKSVHGFSGPIPYRKLPGNRICPSEMILSALGYSNTNDLLGLQDAMDAMISAGVTNMTSVGVNNIYVKNKESFDFEELAAGMNMISGDEKPEALILNHLPPEWFNLANFIIARMEAISGMNSVARGNTEGKDFSGAAMALLQSMAIQFNSGIQRAVAKLTEDCGNDILMLTQDFTPEEKLGMIVGRNNRYMLKSYKGKDLQSVRRTFVRLSNSMKDTTSGRLTIAQDGIKMGAIKDMGAYLEVLETGNLKAATEPLRNARLIIDEENEALMRGEQVPVVLTDMHPDHLMGHRRPFESPDDRKDPALIDNVTMHIQEHLRVWQETEPAVLMALGIPPYPMPPMMGGVDEMGNPLPTEAGAPAGDVVGAPQPNEAQVAGPQPPTNPLSGEEWNPETGGLGG